MKQDITHVTFRKEDEHILAVFIDEKENPTSIYATLDCYTSKEMHSICSPAYYRKLGKATPAEYADLKAELESIGYKLLVK